MEVDSVFRSPRPPRQQQRQRSKSRLRSHSQGTTDIVTSANGTGMSATDLLSKLQDLLSSKASEITSVGQLGEALLNQQAELEARIREVQDDVKRQAVLDGQAQEVFGNGRGDISDSDGEQDAIITQQVHDKVHALEEELARWHRDNHDIYKHSGLANHHDNQRAVADTQANDANQVDNAADHHDPASAGSPARKTPAQSRGEQSLSASRRQRNAAERRVLDVALTADIGQNLVHEIRRLGALLTERDGMIANMRTEKDGMERSMEHQYLRLRSAEDSIQQYKEENWNTGIELQEAQTQLGEVVNTLSRLDAEKSRLSKELAQARDALENHKVDNERLSRNLNDFQAKHELDMANMRRTTAGLQREKVDLQITVETMTKQLTVAARGIRRSVSATSGISINAMIDEHGRPIASDPQDAADDVFGGRRTALSGRADDLFDSDGNLLSDTESAAASPGPRKSAYAGGETEKLRSNLAHSQKTIQALRTALAREKERNTRTKRGANDTANNDNDLGSGSDGEVDSILSSDNENDENLPIRRHRGPTQTRVQRGRGGSRGLRGGLPARRGQHAAVRSIRGPVPSRLSTEVELDSDSSSSHELSFIDHGLGNQSSTRSQLDEVPYDDDQLSHIDTRDDLDAGRNALRSSQSSTAGMDPAFAAILPRSTSSHATGLHSTLTRQARPISSTFSGLNLADQLQQQAIEYADVCIQTDDLPPVEPEVIVQHVPFEVIKEVIVEKEVLREVPVNRIIEKEVLREVPVDRIIEKEVVREIPIDRVIEKEVIREVEKIVEVPFEVIREVEKVIEVPIEVIREVEKIVEVPVEVVREVEVIVEKIVEKVVEKIVEKEVPIEVIVTKEVPIEVTVTRDVPTEHVVYRDVPVRVEVIKEIPREVIVEKQVPYEVIVEKRVEVPVDRIIDREVRVEVEVEKIVHVPVDRIVEKEVEVVVEKRIEVPVEVIVERRIEVPVQVFVDKDVYVDRIVEKEVFIDRILEKEVFIDRIVEKEIPVEVIVYRDACTVDQQQHGQSTPKMPSQDLPLVENTRSAAHHHSESVATSFKSFSRHNTEYDTATETEGEFMDARETLGMSSRLGTASISSRSTITGFAQSDSDADSDAGIRSFKPRPLESRKRRSKAPILPSPRSHGHASVDVGVQTDAVPALPATMVTSATVRDLALAALSPERPQDRQLLTSEEAGVVYLQRMPAQPTSGTSADLPGSTSTQFDDTAAISTGVSSPAAARKTRPPRLALPLPQVPPPSDLVKHATSPLFKPPRPTSPPPSDLMRQYTPGNRSTMSRKRSSLSGGEAMHPNLRANMLASRDEQFYGASPAPLPAGRAPAVPRAIASVAQLREAPPIRFQPPSSDPSAVYYDPLDIARKSGATTPINQMLPTTVQTPMTSARKRKTRAQASVSRASISSMSSIASSIHELGMNCANQEHAQLHKTAGTTDPAILRCIIQTMCGAYFFKYVRNNFMGGRSEKRHCRYFSVVPYTRTLQWSVEDPGAANVTQADIKSLYIAGVREVDDYNTNPVGLLNKSIIVFNESREVKFTAPTQQIHDVWFTSISCLVQNRGDRIDNDDDDAQSMPATPAQSRPDVQATPSSIRSFSLMKTINRSTSSLRFGKYSDPPVASDATRDATLTALRARANPEDSTDYSTARKGAQSQRIASGIDEHGRPRPSTSLGHYYDTAKSGMTSTSKLRYTPAARQKAVPERSYTPVPSTTRSTKAARKMSIISMMSGHHGRDSVAMTGYDIASPAPKRPETPAADYQAAVAAHMASGNEHMFSSPRSVRSYKRPSTAMSLMSPMPPMIVDESIEFIDRRDVLGADVQNFKPSKGKNRHQHTHDTSENMIPHADDTPNATSRAATVSTPTLASRASSTSRRFTAANMMGSISRSTSTLVRRRERQSTNGSNSTSGEGNVKAESVEGASAAAPKLPPPLPAGALSLVGVFEDQGSPSLRGRSLNSTLRGSKSTQALKQRAGSGSVTVKRESSS